jgi:hypothetical protein
MKRVTTRLLTLAMLIASANVVLADTGSCVWSGSGSDKAAACGGATRPVTPELLQEQPWIQGDALASAVAEHTAVPEFGDVLAAMQKHIIEHGLASTFSTQTADPIGNGWEKPVRLAKLTGVVGTLQKDGSYRLDLYQDLAGANGETAYVSVAKMAMDQVPPVETLVLKGDHYTHTVAAVKYSGTL